MARLELAKVCSIWVQAGERVSLNLGWGLGGTRFWVSGI